MQIVIYIIVKALAYSAWCYLGVRLFRADSPTPVAAAIGYGLGRLMLGIVLGLFIFMLAVGMNNAVRSQLLTYLVIYVPVRVGEWTLWYRLMRKDDPQFYGLFWVIGGVVVSCLADIPIAIAEHGLIPVGRPFC
jgi:hypothetical protein